MKRFHLVFGILIVIAFLLTGQYMDRYQNHLSGMPDGMRMLYRTRHIFILLTGLLNVVLGVYFSFWSQFWRKVTEVVGSTLIAAAPVLFVVAFFYEPKLDNLMTPLSLLGTIAVLTGTLLHLFSGIRRRPEGAVETKQ